MSYIKIENLEPKIQNAIAYRLRQEIIVNINKFRVVIFSSSSSFLPLLQFTIHKKER